MAIPQIEIEDFNYTLPEDRIRVIPLEDRAAAKLLVYNKEEITDTVFSELPNFLKKGDLLISNNSKVIPARIIVQKESGAFIEIMCLAPFGTSYTEAFSAHESVSFTAYIGNSKRWKEGKLELKINWNNSNESVFIERKGMEKDAFVVEFTWNFNAVFSEVIEAIGQVPLPPYFQRMPVANDVGRYQTVFAKTEGSVAAPTAGLHYNEGVLSALKENGVNQAQVCLHVGAGTFKPVSSDRIEDHEMHGEFLEVTKACIHSILNCKGRVIAAGTTSMRTLESLYWLGVRVLEGKEAHVVDQWEPYLSSVSYSKEEALKALLDYLDSTNRDSICATSSICIAPGYSFKICSGLQTNYHQPKSTLLLLIAATVGEEWKRIYNHALEQDYMFLSYGDTMLLWL
jgi:S-adenosylmethionine:tRNA ribosyltransferase-isomerase